jgi:hypothetical protein
VSNRQIQSGGSVESIRETSKSSFWRCMKSAIVLVILAIQLAVLQTAAARLVATADTAGTGVGEVTLNGTSTLLDGVLEFGAGTDTATINSFAGFSSVQDWSASLWINYERYKNAGSTADYDYDILGFALEDGEFYLRLDETTPNGSGGTRFRIDAASDQTSSGTTDVTPNEWHHLGVVYTASASQIEFFVDGVANGTTPTTDWLLMYDGNMILGDVPAGKAGMKGQIKGLGLYDEALNGTVAFAGLSEGERPNGSPGPQPTIAYATPEGGWNYAYTGDRSAEDPTNETYALDGRWVRKNGSNSWDGSIIGAGAPGGAMTIANGEDTFLRMQDTGDPRDHGFPDTDSFGSNRRVAVAMNMTPDGASPTLLDDGVTLVMRMRLSTEENGPLDLVYPRGGGETQTWPAGGKGYDLHDGGKGIGIRQSNGKWISFNLTTGPAEGSDYTQAGLAMNSLNGTVPSAFIDVGEGTENVHPLTNLDQWHEFWITIEAGGSGTHQVTVYADGDTIGTVYDVTAGNGSADLSGAISFLSLGLGGTTQYGAYDFDYIAWKSGVHSPIATTPPLLGDLNGDHVVDRRDLAILTKNFGQFGAGMAGGDLDDDGQVTLADLATFHRQFGAVDPEMSPTPAAVPEPSTAALALCGAALFVARRKRTRRPATVS